MAHISLSVFKQSKSLLPLYFLKKSHRDFNAQVSVLNCECALGFKSGQEKSNAYFVFVNEIIFRIRRYDFKFLWIHFKSIFGDTTYYDVH